MKSFELCLFACREKNDTPDLYAKSENTNMSMEIIQIIDF